MDIAARTLWAIGFLVFSAGCSAPVATQHAWPSDEPSAAPADTQAPVNAPLVAPAAEPVAAPVLPMKPGSDDACQAELGWWATNSAFDSTITPSTFASAVNPLLEGQHPVTVTGYVDSSSTWTLRASGTLTGGSYEQYFPYTQPSDAVAMTRQATSFASASPASKGWMVIVDASSTPVWVELAAVSVSASYNDAYCQTLTGGQLDAVIPVSAGSTTIQIGSTTTTVGELLGHPTSSAPKGWNIRLGFDGEKVQVSSK